MGTAVATANNQLALIFNATNWANIADNTATSPNTNLYLALHTADPGASGTQATSEISYTSYARVAVARTTGGWTVPSGGSISPVASGTFPASTGGTGGLANFFSVGMSTSGAGIILYSGTLSPPISVSSGVTPFITTATTIVIT